MANFWSWLSECFFAGFEHGPLKKAEEDLYLRLVKKTEPLLCADVRTIMAKEREKLGEVLPLHPGLIEAINQLLLNPTCWVSDHVVRVPKGALSLCCSLDGVRGANLASIRFAYGSWHVDENEHYYVFTTAVFTSTPPMPPTEGTQSEFC